MAVDTRTFDYFSQGELVPFIRGRTPTTTFDHYRQAELVQGIISPILPQSLLPAAAGIALQAGSGIVLPGVAVIVASAPSITLTSGTGLLVPAAILLTPTAILLTFNPGTGSLDASTGTLQPSPAVVGLTAATATVAPLSEIAGHNTQATLSIRGRTLSGYPDAAELEIHAGNTEIIDFQVLRSDGSPQVIAAWDFRAMLKWSLHDEDEHAVASWTLSGSGIIIDNPTLGNGYVIVQPSDTRLLPAPCRLFLEVQAIDGLGRVHTLQVRVLKVRARVVMAIA
jgi:hypothetical protein